jgi:hypothetical protein
MFIRYDPHDVCVRLGKMTAPGTAREEDPRVEKITGLLGTAANVVKR